MPPQETVYHFQIAPSELRLPPLNPSVDVAPTQITDGVDKAEVAIVDNGLTVIKVLTHVVELHVPSART